MATLNYTQLAQVALSLLVKFGDLGKIGDAATARQAQMCRVKVVDRALLDSDIQVGDFLYYISPTKTDGTDSAPTVGERLSYHGEEMNIVRANAMRPAGITVYYEVYGRLG